MSWRIPNLPLILLLSSVILAGCAGAGREPHPSGTLEATEVDLASTIAGRIEEIRFNLGGTIAKGDTLIRIDVEILRLQRAQTETGLQSLAAQRVLNSDATAQAERTLEWLNQHLKRTEDLTAEGLAQVQQLEELTAKRDGAALQLRSIRHQQGALDAEEAKLRAGIALIDRQIGEGVIVAPIDGTAILRAAEPGELATPGKILGRIADLSRLELRFFVGSESLSRINLGESVKIQMDAFPNESFSGIVSWISSEAEFTPKNAQTRDARLQLVYAVKLTVANPGGRLKIGMPAEAIL